ESFSLHTLGNKGWTPAERLRHFAEQMVRTQAEIRKMGGCPFGNFAAALSSEKGDERATRFRAALSRLFYRMAEGLRECLEEGIARREFREHIPAGYMAAFL